MEEKKDKEKEGRETFLSAAEMPHFLIFLEKKDITLKKGMTVKNERIVEQVYNWTELEESLIESEDGDGNIKNLISLFKRSLLKHEARYRNEKTPHAPEEAPFIEEGIRPLVVSLCRWGCFKVNLSCEGHPDNEKFNTPYAHFSKKDGCKEEAEFALKVIKKSLNDTGWGIFKGEHGVLVNRDTGKYHYYGWAIRPYKGKEIKTSVSDIAELIYPEVPDYYNVVFQYDKDEDKKKGG